MSNRQIAAVCLLCFAAGWFAPSVAQPAKDRPVLKAIVKFAKTALWFAAFAEPAPSPDPEHQSVMVDDQGYAVLDHSRGW